MTENESSREEPRDGKEDVPALPAVAPYSFDPADVTIAVELVDHGFSVAERWGVAPAIRSELANRDLPADDPLALELVRLTYAQLHVETEPSIATSRVRLSGSVDLVTPDVLQLWAAVEPLLNVPAARAVVAELLWERRIASPVLHARTAIDAYLDQARSMASSLQSTDVTVRAWDLARRIGDVGRAGAAEAIAIEAARAALDTEDYNPGVTLPLLSLLTSAPMPSQSRQDAYRADVDELLERALEAYAFHNASDVVALMRRHAADDGEVTDLNRRHTAMLLRQAIETPDGLLKQSRLGEVAALARGYGQAQVVTDATTAMQGISPASLGLQRIESTQTLPIDVRETALDRYTRGRDWRHGLDAFLFSPPPTGRRVDLEAQAKEYLAAGHLHTLFGSVSLTREGLPSHTTEPGDLTHAMAYQAGFRAAIFGELLATGLLRVADTYGVPPVDAIRRHIVDRGASDLDLADALARSIHHFWTSDFDSALHLITPRIETAARSLLRECDIAIYRTQVGQSKGGYIGLYGLIEQLEALALDPDWAYFLRYVLLGPNGMNIRDDVAHGLIAHAGPVPAALALRAAAVLILITGPTAPLDWEDPDGPPVSGGDGARSIPSIVNLLRRPTAAGQLGRGRRLLARTLSFTARRLDRAAFVVASAATAPSPGRHWSAPRSRQGRRSD